MDAKEQALEQVRRATAEAVQAAQEHLDRGVHPGAVAVALTTMADGLSPDAQASLAQQVAASLPADAQVRHTTKVVAKLADDQKAAVAQTATDGMSDEEFERFVAAQRARRSGNLPASPPG